MYEGKRTITLHSVSYCLFNPHMFFLLKRYLKSSVVKPQCNIQHISVQYLSDSIPGFIKIIISVLPKKPKYRYQIALNNISKIHWNCEDSKIKRIHIWLCICKHSFLLSCVYFSEDKVKLQSIGFFVFKARFQHIFMSFLSPHRFFLWVFIPKFVNVTDWSEAGETVQTLVWEQNLKNVFSHIYFLCVHVSV